MTNGSKWFWLKRVILSTRRNRARSCSVDPQILFVHLLEITEASGTILNNIITTKILILEKKMGGFVSKDLRIYFVR